MWMQRMALLMRSIYMSIYSMSMLQLIPHNRNDIELYTDIAPTVHTFLVYTCIGIYVYKSFYFYVFLF